MPTNQNSYSLVLLVRDLTGGIRRHVVSLLSMFVESPERVTIVTNLSDADATFLKYLSEHPQFRSRVVDVAIRRPPHPLDFVQLLQLWWRFRGVRASGRSDLPDAEPGSRVIFHGHGAKGGMFARVLGRLCGGKTVYTAHGGSTHAMYGSMMNVVYRLIERVLFLLTDCVILESKYSYSAYQSIVGGSEAGAGRGAETKLHLNYNGVAFSELPNAGANASPSAANGVGRTGKFTVGAFGALRDIKGYDLLIVAASIAQGRGEEIHVRLYGEGPEHDRLTALAADLNVSAQVTVGMKTDDVLSAMRECDAVAQPSRFESFGYSTLEAISVGVPVVVTNVGGLVELVGEGGGVGGLRDGGAVVGQLVPPDDANALADALIWIKQHPREARATAERAYIRAKDQFNEQKMLANLSAIYQKL